jgi:hypothetical protein
MFVVPFFCRTPVGSLIPWCLQPIVVFLENRGKQLCQVESPKQWLDENGFVIQQTWQEGDILYAEVRPDSMKLSDFYSFEQLTIQQQKGTEECWRTFFLMKSNEDPKSSQSWNQLLDSPFFAVLQAIQTKCKL